MMVLYIFIGAFVTFALYRLYILADSKHGEWWDNKAGYCVTIGATWPITALFAFAVYFAKYGIPKELKEDKRK